MNFFPFMLLLILFEAIQGENMVPELSELIEPKPLIENIFNVNVMLGMKTTKKKPTTRKRKTTTKKRKPVG